MLPDRQTPLLTPERRQLLERIVADGDRRRRTRLVGASAALVLVVGLVGAVLTTVGESDRDRQTLTADGGTASTARVGPATAVLD
ncbi:MAG TPA: hypothetical protein VF244_08505, partial [Acidimicrobiales bacterium]